MKTNINEDKSRYLLTWHGSFLVPILVAVAFVLPLAVSDKTVVLQNDQQLNVEQKSIAVLSCGLELLY